MKLDTEFTTVYRCPKTNLMLDSFNATMLETCPYCGFYTNSLLKTEHMVKETGKWDRPSMFEKLFYKNKAVFLSGENLSKAQGPEEI